MIDLHMHSHFSDGTHSPLDILHLAKNNGLKAIALTDHDTIAGIKDMSKYAFDFDIEIINGIEFSCMYNNIEVHILGYFIDIENKELLNFLDNLKASREKRNIELVEYLQNLGVKISLDAIMSKTNCKMITKSHFGQYLALAGYVNNPKDAFRTYLKNDIKRDLLSCKDAIKLIHNANGICSLAHPLSYRLDKYDALDLITALSKDGLDAMECYYSSHTKKQVKYLLNICNNLNLLETAGSDFHGDNRKGVNIGEIYVGKKIDYNIVKELKAYERKNRNKNYFTK